MKPSSPWSIKGVEPEAREAAKMSARRAGVPLGVWLSATIRKAASEQLRSGGGSPAERAASSPAQNFGSDATAAGNAGNNNGSRIPAPTTEAVLQSINRLAAKLEESERRTTETLEPLAEKVRSLSEQIEDVKEAKALDSSPMERALARMAERLDEIEEGPRIGRGAPSGSSPRDEGHGRREPRRRQGFFSRLFSD